MAKGPTHTAQGAGHRPSAARSSEDGVATAGFPPNFLDGFLPRSLTKGHVLSTPSHPLNQVFVVRSGRLKVYLANDTREISLAILEAGDLFSTHTPTYVRTLESTELWVIDTGQFARKLAAQPTVSPLMMRVLGRILSNAITLVEDLAFRDVPARLARFLIRQAEQRGVAAADGCLLPLNLGTEDIACLLGTTRQSVSSLINQWQREGLLTRHGRHALMIHDAQALVARSLANNP
ncbi:MAG TPA: Crp/Fnr family transcriptional regulator [Rhodocyclaceae bacterium]|jgi:CRP-like cAMP-binding protein|nr:Crp/Fnr family transcriptional regulator [Rhodocyclaceae bacterium]